MTPEQKVFLAAIKQRLAERGALLLSAETAVIGQLKAARAQIMEQLANQPSDFNQWRLPQLLEQIDAVLSGALWCVSSVAAERLPAWSRRRAGRMGGVRFKRIKLDPARWDFVRLRGDARHAAVRARIHEGGLYDWQQVAGYLAWLIPDKDGRWSCAELCATALGMAEPWRMDPCSLHRVAQWAHAQHDAGR